MALFGPSLKRIARRMQRCEEWIEMVRDLREPIAPGRAPTGFELRWGQAGDLEAINALEGFVQETESLAASLRQGDRCLLLSQDGQVRAFAWVTFRDVRMALWYTLRLPAGWCYLEYIFVHPAVAGRGVGTYLLGCLLAALRDQGCSHMIAGMYGTWEASIRLHAKMGFRIQRRLTQCKLLGIFPVPPAVDPVQ
jgi:GNAT superfamily N-acetyltransferase